MGRRLAEATKAARARRTRGETGLRRFFAPALWADAFREVDFEVAAFLAAALAEECVSDFAADFEAAFAELAGLLVEDEGVDCATRIGADATKKKSVRRTSETANLRTAPYLGLKIGTHLEVGTHHI
jgi:hypothetical protein